MFGRAFRPCEASLDRTTILHGHINNLEQAILKQYCFYTFSSGFGEVSGAGGGGLGAGAGAGGRTGLFSIRTCISLRGV